jgi:hypothetical protein
MRRHGLLLQQHLHRRNHGVRYKRWNLSGGALLGLWRHRADLLLERVLRRSFV